MLYTIIYSAEQETHLKCCILLSQLSKLVDQLLMSFICFLPLDLFLNSPTFSLLNLRNMIGTISSS